MGSDRAPRTSGGVVAARLDLHMHTVLSDGRYPPERVLSDCAAGGLDVVAITDHDLPPTLAAGAHTVNGKTLRLVHGVELSTYHGDGEQHLLVWFPDEMPADFRDFCTGRAQARAGRYAAALQSLGLDGLDGPDAAAVAGRRSLTRNHLAKAIVRAGHARSYADAMRRYAHSSNGHVPSIRLPMLDAIQTARDAGGLTAWAHPSPERCKAWLPTLAKGGLQGIEGIRPGQGRKVRQGFRKLAAKHKVLVTGGSDSHGQPGRHLGHFAVSGDASLPLLRALGPGGPPRSATAA